MPRNHKDQYQNGFTYWMIETGCGDANQLPARDSRWKKWRVDTHSRGVDMHACHGTDGWQRIGDLVARDVFWHPTRPLNLDEIG